MLKLESLTKTRGNFHANFDLAIEPGERVVLHGSNGSGKSTLLNMIAGFVRPDSGKLQWDGRDLLALAPHQRPLTMLFQEHNLLTHISVLRNLALAFDPYARLNAQQRQAVTAILQRMGLAHLASRLPYELSGGQRQRVALARCLLQKKPLLMLDEPFVALDEESRATMLELIDALIDEYACTLLLVSHRLDDAQAICARQLRCVQGRIAPHQID